MATTFVVSAADHMRPHRNTRIMYFPEASSQSFKAGHVVILSSGKVAKGGSDPSANTVLGIAAEAASGTADTQIGVYVADAMAEFSGRAQDTGAPAITHIGTQVGIVLDSGNDIFRVDLSEGSAVKVTITELLDASADVNGRVVFKWMNAARLPQWD